MQALRVDCPGLETALADLGVEPLLPANWRNRISPGELADIGVLQEHYAQSSLGSSLSSARLRSIAQQLGPPPSAGSWWERFKRWLASWLDSESNRWPSWLRYLPNLGSAARYFVYGSVALLVIGALAVVVVELRAAGLLASGRRRPARNGRPSPARPVQIESPASPADLEATPEHLRPVILLRLLVTALTHSNRIERDGVLTCRELIHTARLDTPAQREIFTNVALSAERALYADPLRPAAPSQDDLLAGARGLYDQLLAGAAAQPAP